MLGDLLKSMIHILAAKKGVDTLSGLFKFRTLKKACLCYIGTLKTQGGNNLEYLIFLKKVKVKQISELPSIQLKCIELPQSEQSKLH